jgi:cytochrome b pre-mRNA-processing protein 3
MDQSLREQSVGDSGVLRHVQKMGEALFGRIAAYDTLEKEALTPAIARNIFRTEAPDEAQQEAAEKLADYLIEMRQRLTNAPLETLMKQPLHWPKIDAIKNKK